MSDCRCVAAGLTAPATLFLREHERCRCESLSKEQATTLRERFARQLTVDWNWSLGAWELTAKQYVGIIVLDDLRIHIEPKVNLQNLFYMLTYAYDLADFRWEATALAPSEEIFEFIVVIFLRQVEQLVQRGIYRTYITQEESQPYLRGRLLLADHLQRNTLHVQRFYQRTNEFTADVLENRILRYTLGILARLDFREPGLRQQIRRVASAFAEVSPVTIAPADCDRVLYTRLNAVYRSRINLARLLIQHLSLESRPGEVAFASYLLDMNRVFELFVARFLTGYFAHEPSILVDIQPDTWLDTDLQEKGIPDIVLRRNGRPYLVLDTKYKRFNGKPEEVDRNQMVTYCHALGLPRGILIYADDHVVNYSADFKDIVLHAISLALYGSLGTFKERCQQFARQFVEGI